MRLFQIAVVIFQSTVASDLCSEELFNLVFIDGIHGFKAFEISLKGHSHITSL